MQKDLVSSLVMHFTTSQIFVGFSITVQKTKTKKSRFCEYDTVANFAFKMVINTCQNLIQEPRVISLSLLRTITHNDFSVNNLVWSDVQQKNFVHKVKQVMGDSICFIHANHKNIHHH